MVKAKLRLQLALLLALALVGGGFYTAATNNDEDRVKVLLTVTLKLLRPEKGVQLLITYKASSSEWRGPVKHYPVIHNSRETDPWNKTVSVRKGDTVYLRSNQAIANEMTCLISVPGNPGVWSKPVTRRSIGTVKCELFIQP